MATLKSLLDKITGTQGIEKITKSMKMVSAAKLRGDQVRLENGKAFGVSVNAMIPEKVSTEVYLEGEYEADYPASSSSGIVMISSDRGLCGGANSQPSKLCKAVVDDCEDAKIILVGDKARGPLMRTHSEHIVQSMDEVWKPPMNFGKASMIATRVLAMGEFEDVKVVYNTYQSVVKFDPTMQPVRMFSVIADPAAELPEPLNNYELEPEVPAEVLMNLSEFILATKILHCSLENATSEQSSRMNAMENASKNAGEMIEKLQIKYNRARQAKITTELIEIISGAESLKD